MDNNIQIEELKGQVQKLRTELDSLSQSFFKNNFSSSQSFTKDVTFQTRLRVPIYTSAPSICEVGDLICIAGVLYICTVANTTFTVVGTQT
jgi:hypothetical protein